MTKNVPDNTNYIEDFYKRGVSESFIYLCNFVVSLFVFFSAKL